MKHVFKVEDSGKWAAESGENYTVKTLQNGDKMPKGFSETLAAALKKKTKAKPKPVVEDYIQPQLDVEPTNEVG